MLAEDKAFFTGSGSGQPRGISIESISQVDAGGAPTFDDIIDLIDSVPSRVTSSPKAAFVGHRNAKRAFRKMKDNKSSSKSNASTKNVIKIRNLLSLAPLSP